MMTKSFNQKTGSVLCPSGYLIIVAAKSNNCLESIVVCRTAKDAIEKLGGVRILLYIIGVQKAARQAILY